MGWIARVRRTAHLEVVATRGLLAGDRQRSACGGRLPQ